MRWREYIEQNKPLGLLLLLALVAAIAGPIMLLTSGWEALRIRSVIANGIETTATIKGGVVDVTRRPGPGGRVVDEKPFLDLAWTDLRGKHREESVKITRGFMQSISGWGNLPSTRSLRREQLKIKYVPDWQKSAVILEDAADRLREEDPYAIAGLVLTPFGFGFLILLRLWWSRRIRRAAAA